ncbi:MAG: MucB/RseB C-terminal domain-containing protein [Woeseiaceae bacterium]|jgi:sigma-E factor negative regulatory protein RseB
MTRLRPQIVATAGVVFVGLYVALVSAQEESPAWWLEKMAGAVATTNYEGTVVRLQGDKVEALKVVHLIKDGVVQERVIVLDEDGIEIIRNGNEVHSIVPEKQKVLVEEWNDESALFSSLPTSDDQLGSQYELLFGSEGRVAGRDTIMLAIKPIDDLRFGHRIWVDVETGFPLQTKLIDGAGKAIEHIRFADISLNREITDNTFAPSTNIDNYQFYTQRKRKITSTVDSPWQSDDLPAGFRVISTHEEKLSGRDTAVTHIMYSDGLARVSVFVEPAADKNFEGHSQMGASNSYSAVVDGFSVTAVGEVPAVTVERIATSMRRN